VKQTFFKKKKRRRRKERKKEIEGDERENID
jgi:hypothetical protein